ncbi:MAG: RHS repeat-associated core domain-containing protein [Spirochaetota bacterium]
MITAEQLKNSTNLYNGTLAFHVPLASLVGVKHSTFTLQASYNGNVARTVAYDNLLAPTSTLGLGWELALEKIISVPDWSNSASNTKYFYLGEGGFNEMLQTASDAHTRTYGLTGYKFYKITYHLANDYWTIVKENGTTYTYGSPQTASSNTGTEKAVSRETWLGSSAITGNETNFSTGWSLTSIADLWKNQMTFTYEAEDISVGQGGLSFTRAQYLSKITDTVGQTATFTYNNKATNEYQNPHVAANGINAWQDRFETKFLESIAVSAAPISPTSSASELYTIRFGYTDSSGSTEFLGTGEMAKRLLTGITRVYPGNNSLPGLKFSYQKTASDPSYGSLLSAITEEGGLIEYTYQNVTTQNSTRNVPLAKPTKSGVTYSNPRFWFKNRYVVVTWLGSDGNCPVTIYSWEGRWLSQQVCEFSASNESSYNASKVVLSDLLFSVLIDEKLYAFHKNVKLAGNWLGDSAGTALSLNAGENTRATAGDRFISIVGLSSGKLNTLYWNGSSWVARPLITLQSGAVGLVCDIAAKNNYLYAASTLGNTPTASIENRFEYIDAEGNWQSLQTTSHPNISLVSTLQVKAQAAFLYLGYGGPSANNTAYSYNAATWSENFSNFSFTELTRETISQTTQPPLVFTDNTRVSIAQKQFRFDGQSWNLQNLSSITYPDESKINSFSQGFDKVIRTIQKTDGSLLFDLLQYNPADISASGRWSVPTNLAGVAAKTNGSVVSSVAITDKEEDSNYAIFNNALYYQNPDATWTKAFDIPDTLTATEASTLRLYSSNYFIYQVADKTIVYPVQNGNIASTGRIEFSNNSILPQGDTGQGFSGENSFITYSGQWGSSMELNLHAIVEKDAQGELSNPVVAGVTLYSLGKSTGPSPLYGTNQSAHAFAGSTAVAMTEGYGALYNHVESAEGTTAITSDASSTPFGKSIVYFFNGLSSTETPSHPYPTGTNTNATDYLALLLGQSYTSENTKYVPATTGTTAAQVTITSFTNSIWVYEKNLWPNRPGFYARSKETQSQLDGVTATVISEYSTDTGLSTSIASTKYNSAGTLDTMTEEFLYWWEKYDPDRSNNLLTPVVQTTRKQNNNIIGISITTWKNDWGYSEKSWAIEAEYIALQADPATFNKWTENSSPLASGWRLISLVATRIATGLPNLVQDSIGRDSSLVYDTKGHYLVSSFANADANGQEASYYGFESYEKDRYWSYLGGTITNNRVSGEAHAGKWSLQIPAVPGAQNGPTASFVPNTQNRRYLFAGWVQTAAGFSGVTGDAQWVISLYTVETSPRKLGNDVVLPFPETNGSWQYFHTVIDLAKVRIDNNIASGTNVSITILGYNQKAGQVPLVDGLTFLAVDASFNTTVYDENTFLTIANEEANGATNQIVRDSLYRPTALIGPDNNVAGITQTTPGRLLNGDSELAAEFPNSIMNINASSSGFYYNFEESDAGAWNLATGWSMANGKLSFTGTAAPPLGSQASLKTFANYNFAAWVKIIPAQGTTPNTGIGANNIYVYWDSATHKWNLCYVTGGSTTTVASTQGPGYKSDILFTIIDNFVSFFAGGIEVFSYQLPETTRADGSFFLSLAAAASFSDLVLSTDPQTEFSLLDGRGKVFQKLYLQDGKDFAATGSIDDAIGRTSYQKNPVYYSIQLDANDNLVEGGIANYLPDSSGQQMTLAEYLSPSGGYQYQQTIFENSPLNRAVKQGQPGASYSVASPNATSIVYGCTGATAPFNVMNDLLPTGSDGHYYLQEITDANAVKQYRLSNQVGQLIAERTQTATNTYSTTFYIYDALGNVSEVRPPNYYSPPTSSANTDWVQTNTCNFIGELVASAMPDSGTVQYMYDSVGRLRFKLDADGVAQETTGNPKAQRIVYYCYDGLDRLLEQGYVQNTGINWSGLAAHVDDQSWPNASLSPHWYIRNTYDYSGSDSSNLIGRLWQTEVNASGDGTSSNTERYSYDLRGNILSQTITVPSYGAQSYQTSYQYNNQNQLAQITYPAKLSGATVQGSPFALSYSYNRLGQLAAVGIPPAGNEVVDPQNPASGPEASFATYFYNAQGILQQENLNNTNTEKKLERNFSCNTAGWLTDIQGDFYQQSLTYDNGGVGGAAYYNGNIASNTSTTSTYFSKNQTVDPFFSSAFTQEQWKYKYDNLGRLLTAESVTDKQDQSLSIGLTPSEIAYDANGNLTSVPRMSATETYSYQAGGKISNNRVQSVSTGVTLSIDFTATDNPGWSWGASNLGPSDSEVVDTPSDTGTNDNNPPSTKSLRVGGGSLGHQEYLQYQGYLDPRGSYTLSYWLKTETGFEQQGGEAGWYLRLSNASGTIVDVLVDDFAAGSATWKQCGPITIDLASKIASMGLGETITSYSLVLLNAKTSGNSSAAASLYVTNITLAGNGATGTYVYDNNGNVTASPARGLTSLEYNPITGLATNINKTGAAAANFAYSYDAQGLRVSESLSVAGKTLKRLYLRDISGKVLACVESDGSTETEISYLHGANGLLAMKNGTGVSYVLKDHLGSTRALVDESANVIQSYRYDPFGEILQETSRTDALYTYTGQEYNSNLGLYNYNARLYDAALRRFYETDPAGQYASPYTYVGNDPVNRVDPSGRDAIILVNEANKKITVKSDIIIYGASADDALAKFYQQDIINQWNKGFLYNDKTRNITYTVDFAVNVRHENITGTPWSSYLGGTGTNYIHVPNFDSPRSYVAALKYTGEWYAKDDTRGFAVAAHEFGHLLGLPDRYIEKDSDKYWKPWFRYWGGWLVGNFADPKGYEDNLMNKHWSGHVYQTDINTIVGPAVSAHKIGKNETTYYLTPRYSDLARLLGLEIGVLGAGSGIYYGIPWALGHMRNLGNTALRQLRRRRNMPIILLAATLLGTAGYAYVWFNKE